MLKRLWAYYRLTKIKERLKNDPIFLRVLLPVDVGALKYDVNLIELSYGSLVLQVFNDNETVLAIEYRNGQYLYCPKIGNVVSHQSGSAIFQQSIDLTEVVSEVCGLGISFLRPNAQGAPAIYIAIPLTASDVTPKKLCKLVMELQAQLEGPVEQGIRGYLERMADIEAMVQEFPDEEDEDED